MNTISFPAFAEMFLRRFSRDGVHKTRAIQENAAHDVVARWAELDIDDDIFNERVGRLSEALRTAPYCEYTDVTLLEHGDEVVAFEPPVRVLVTKWNDHTREEAGE